MRALAACLGLMALIAGAVRAESAGDIIEPDPQEIPAPNKTKPDSTPADQSAQTDRFEINEPDFKAKITVPPPPIGTLDKQPEPAKKPKKRSEWAVAPEEGVEEDRGEDSVEQDDRSQNEELSPLLSKVMERDKPGKSPKDRVELYRQVVEAEPENAAALYRLGLAQARHAAASVDPKLDRVQELSAGAVNLEKAVQLKPTNLKYQCDFGLAALQIGWLEKALLACQTAAQNAPAEPRFQSAFGDCLVGAGKLDEAAHAYRRAINLTKGRNPDFIYNLGLVCLHAHEFKQAVKIFDEAIKLRQDSAAYYCSRGLAYENSKEVKRAISDYQLALKLDKNNAYAHFLLAGVYSDAEDPTYTNKFEALEHAEKAVKLTQYKNARYLMGLARALLVCRNYPQAAFIARKAVELDPKENYRRELGKLEQLKNESLDGQTQKIPK